MGPVFNTARGVVVESMREQNIHVRPHSTEVIGQHGWHLVYRFYMCPQVLWAAFRSYTASPVYSVPKLLRHSRCREPGCITLPPPPLLTTISAPLVFETRM